MHGCPICYKTGRDLPLKNSPDETMNLRCEKIPCTDEAILRVKIRDGSQKYNLITLWECELNEMKRSNPALRDFCATHMGDYLVEPVDPKDVISVQPI